MTNQDWQASLLTQGAAPDFAHFADPAAELQAAAVGSVTVPLVDLGVIRVSGEDAAGFLHNLLTNDISKLAANEIRRAGLCSPKGRLLADLLIWREAADYLLALPADLLPAILKRLSMFVLRAKVRLVDASQERPLLGLAGATAAELVAGLAGSVPAVRGSLGFEGGSILRLDQQRFVLAADQSIASTWASLTATARPAGLAAWRWLEIAAGDPRVELATQDQFIPQMLNYDKVGGLVFNKGCYPGQEIVARTQYLGKIKRHMYRARLNAATVAVGDPVYAPETAEQACGSVLSVAPSPLGGVEFLAVVQTSCVEAGELHLGSPAGPRPQLLELPYPLA